MLMILRKKVRQNQFIKRFKKGLNLKKILKVKKNGSNWLVFCLNQKKSKIETVYIQINLKKFSLLPRYIQLGLNNKLPIYHWLCFSFGKYKVTDMIQNNINLI